MLFYPIFFPEKTLLKIDLFVRGLMCRFQYIVWLRGYSFGQDAVHQQKNHPLERRSN